MASLFRRNCLIMPRSRYDARSHQRPNRIPTVVESHTNNNGCRSEIGLGFRWWPPPSLLLCFFLFCCFPLVDSCERTGGASHPSMLALATTRIPASLDNMLFASLVHHQRVLFCECCPRCVSQHTPGSCLTLDLDLLQLAPDGYMGTIRTLRPRMP